MNTSGRLDADWPAPPGVRAFATTREGGAGTGAFHSFNLSYRVGDDAATVDANRRRLGTWLPAEPRWLRQVHGNRVVDAASVTDPVDADAAVTRECGVVCTISIADCLPVLFCDRAGSVVAAAHAGWRGLSGGVLENTVAAMNCKASDVMAWLGPGIGPTAFEVGEDVYAAFVQPEPQAADAFQPHATGKWLCDLFALARLRLGRLGVTAIHGGGHCTYRDAGRFFSYRRDRTTGRMAAFVWLENT
ncbi:MAG: peptidoglycan editing factor PgeF [Burkholderiales bacterium]